MIDASNDIYIPLVLLLSVTGAVVAPWLAIRGVRLLSRTGTKRATLALIKGVAALACACSAAVYTWGLLHLMILDESGQAQACSERLNSEQYEFVDGYEYSFIPLSFNCRVNSGQTYEAVVPGYVNPTTGMFGLTAAALTVAARYHENKEETKK
ncbi:hypothetical protein [Streptomyces pacificus]|uniref:Uncharacterized protein n=1 Tax=Streptomyces pacificus TaxID=2705029 RepID=A0A6A0B0M8_9ACTN|nr:hypothetical protein [Streptomyces pacificus]GFH37804.1 hypothetical protein SCWH03_40440 [Streptomyces pacificus]